MPRSFTIQEESEKNVGTKVELAVGGEMTMTSIIASLLRFYPHASRLESRYKDPVANDQTQNERGLDKSEYAIAVFGSANPKTRNQPGYTKTRISQR